MSQYRIVRIRIFLQLYGVGPYAYVMYRVSHLFIDIIYIFRSGTGNVFSTKSTPPPSSFELSKQKPKNSQKHILKQKKAWPAS